MAKLEQALLLDPPTELHFKAPFTDVTNTFLNLSNPTDKPICYKVKTTAPKTYCVRPSSGVIGPKDTVAINVMLQPFDIETDSYNCKHKFMVQSMFAPEGEFNLDNSWREASADTYMNSKLKCVFDIDSDTIQTTADVLETSKEDIRGSRVQDIGKNASPKIANLEEEAFKLLDENKKLEKELWELRRDNASLKADGLRHRHIEETGEKTSDTRSRGIQSTEMQYQLNDNQQPIFPNIIFVIVAFVFCIGLYLGKRVF